MKQKIHPKYSSATIKCACGNEIKTASTKEKMEVELCSVCHPFYTGKQKLVDTGGRVERFKKRLAKRKTTKPKAKAPAKGGSASGGKKTKKTPKKS